MLLIALIADAAQNGMAGDYHSIPTGVLLVATLMFWNVFLEWVGFHWQFFDRLIDPPPLTLVKNGRMLRENMRKELISEDDLRS